MEVGFVPKTEGQTTEYGRGVEVSVQGVDGTILT